MIAQDSLLVQLLRLVDLAPNPRPETRPRRGRPRLYSEELFIKALMVMVLRRIHRVGELLAVLEEETSEMRAIRGLLFEGGRMPSRRTFERRLRSLPESLPERIGLMGRYLVELMKPWAKTGRAVAVDSTALFARGGVWHKKDREAGVVPHTSMDTEAGWTKSGWHGWVYGWKLHLACTVGSVWIPLAAHLTPANVHDSTLAETLIEELPDEARFVLGDTHYNTSEVLKECSRSGRLLVASGRRGPYPHTDSGVEVRRICCTGCATRPSRTSMNTSQGHFRLSRAGADERAA